MKSAKSKLTKMKSQRKSNANFFAPLLAASAVAIFAFAAAACSKGAGGASNSVMMEYAADAAAPRMAMAKAAPMQANFAAADSAASLSSVADAGTLPQERKLIRTGNLSLEVTSLADTLSDVEAWVARYGGWISDNSQDTSSLNVTARIPAARFDEAMADVSGIGRLLSKSISSNDVTERFYDLETRLSTRRILLERLETYLREASDVKDLLEIEREVNDVTTELESMQGQFNRLSNQIDYSTIYIDAHLPYNHTEEGGFVFPDMKAAFIEFAETVLRFFTRLVFVIFYIIIFGVPIVLLAFLLYWLCFGKIGLVRKLFNKVRAGKKKD